MAPDAPAHAAVRPSRRARRADGAVRRLGDARPVRGRDPGAPGGAHRRRRLRRLPHGRDRGRGPARARAAAGLLSNDLDRIEPGEAQYTLLTNERGGMIDDLIAYRLGEFRYLLVVNASNRDADFALAQGARDSRLRRDATSRTSTRCSPCRGRGRSSGSACRPRQPFTFAEATIDGVEVMVNRTGYTGEDGVRAAVHGARTRSTLWDAVLARGVDAVRARRARHAPPRGLLPAARQRHRARHGRDLGGPRLGVRARQGVHRGRGAAPGQGAGPRRASSSRS